MIEAITEGIIGGLILTIFIGPVFMYLIEVSIKKGIKQALFVDLGVFISDVSAILISFAFMNQLRFLDEERAATGIIGGTIFIVFGIIYIVKSSKPPTSSASPELADQVVKKVKRVSGKQQLMNVLKGFLLNMINPSVLIYWLGVMIVAKQSFGSNNNEIFTFFAALLITFFALDAVKIIGASRLRKLLSPAVIERINIFSGIAFIVLGGISVVIGLINL